MLKNRYQEVLVGLNLTSLIRGIISLRRKRSTLLIDDPRFKASNYPGHFLSELEILALSRLGQNFDVPELADLREFLSPATVDLVTPQLRLRLGRSPLENLQEVLRKFPELIDENDLDQLYAETSSGFENYFMEELKRYESLCYEASFRAKGFRFEIQGPKWFKTIYSRFGETLNREYALSKDLKFQSLLHLLSLSFEEKLKTRMAPEEIPFYFFRMLSPIHRLQDFFLTTQLKRRLSLLGGDYKESSVQFWQLHDNKFENLLLESFEGVISGDRVLFFSHLPEEVPFRVHSPFGVFRKTQMLPQKRPSNPFPPTALTFMADENMLGSELPYRVMMEFDHGPATYHWPYPELPGSKAAFYQQATTTAFEQDARMIPFDMKEPVFQGVQSVSLDMRKLQDQRKTEASILSRLPLEVVSADKPVQGFEYWGPFRYRSLGILALCYGVEGV